PLRLESGTAALRFANLPVSIVPDGVRASVSKGSVVSVAVRHAAPGEESLDHPLRQKLKRVQSDLRVEEDRLANFREQIKLLNTFGQHATSQSDRDVRQNAIRLETWADVLKFMEEKRRDYQEKIRKAESRLQELRKEEAVLNDQTGRMNMASRRAQIEVEVTCAGTPGDEVKVTLEYLVTGVSWQGIYDLYSTSEGPDFRLESRAAVKQSTGEDWTNVSLSISSARPSSGTSPGVLRPWRITGGGISPAQAGKTGNSAGDNEESHDRPDNADMSDASETSTFTVQLPGRETIASDNSEHRIVISRSELKGAVTLVAVLSLSTFVYLKARLRNTTGMPLLWGTVNTFVDGSFTGSAALARRAAVGEEFEVFLGPDQRLVVKRTLMRGDVAGTGILSKKVEIQNQWEIEVANFTKKPRRVLVLDQFPITGDPLISTKFGGSSRTDVKTDANGMLTWNLEVRPGESQKFDFSYSMEIPTEIWDRLERRLKEADAKRGMNQQNDEELPSKSKRMYNLEKMFMK
ncbi:MAG: mucoidy inhibitor MuiA family protein, partial [Spirochaetia bacterium]|nr:mucoidy inhibitor MuiA family protein [Spirochaetia bacterium]